MEGIIPIVTVLFMLSMICERVAEFFKNYLCRKKIKGLYWIGDTLTKYPDGSPAEMRRAYRILKLNLFFGFITAFAAHASLFDLLANLANPAEKLGWENKFKFSSIYTDVTGNLGFLLGCAFTGAFISLGSKFWHDLLDILLAIKNNKKAVNEALATQDYNGLPDSEKFALGTAAIKENKENWKNTISNYRGVTVANKLNGAEKTQTNLLSIRFSVTKKDTIKTGSVNGVPEFIFYGGYKIPTDVIETGETTAIATDPTLRPRPLGSSIGRGDTSHSGTLGLRAKLKVGNKTVLCGVSCYHVLFPEELKKSVLEILSDKDPKIIGSHEVFGPSKADFPNDIGAIGSVVQGNFSSFLDIGFFITKPSSVDKNVDNIKIKSPYELSIADQGSLKVKMYGRSTDISRGTVIAVSLDQIIGYFSSSATDAFTHELLGLIQIEMKGQGGDSGSILLTENNELLGIVVAADANYTYAMHIQSLTHNYDITFDI